MYTSESVPSLDNARIKRACGSSEDVKITCCDGVWLGTCKSQKPIITPSLEVIADYLLNCRVSMYDIDLAIEQALAAKGD